MALLPNNDQVLAFQRDGVVLLRQLFDARWLEVVAEGVAETLHRPSKRTTDYLNDPASGDHFFYDARTLGEVEAFDHFMLESPMAEAISRLMMSSQAILFYISVFVRSAGVRARTPWHQDQKSWSAEGLQACSAWTPLDPVPRETALEFVRASHNWEREYQRAGFFEIRYEGDDRTRLPPFPDIESRRDEFEILAWDMEPGDCLVFHGMTAHGGSGDLPADLGRRAVSVQWLGDDARFRLLPGGDDPHISEELLRRGIKPGDPPICDICPCAWPRS